MAQSVPRLAPRHLVYVDEARTHELHAEVEPAPDEDRLVTTEFPAGSRDPAEAIQTARRVTAEAEVQQALSQIERRLKLAGKYFRADVADMRWVALGPPSESVDMRAIDVPIPGAPEGARMTFHHFHAPAGEDRLIISMPRLDAGFAGRHALAELAFRFPRVEAGDLTLLHARLTATTLRSTLVERHLELPRKGFKKLIEAGDYQAAYGNDWAQTTREVLGRAADRMLGAHANGPLMTRAGGRVPEQVAEIARGLASGRIAALKARLLAPGEAEVAFEAGEHGIRRLVNAKRRALAHTAAYELSVLEASLLLEYAMRYEVWSLVHEEGEKLLRYVHGYR